jgi:rare lipoprotein A
MRGTQLFGVAALVMASGIAVLPVSAATPSPSVAIREVGVPSSGEEPFLRTPPTMTPSPQGQLQIATSRPGKVLNGQASWYGPGFYGNRTANGEVFRPGAFTAAHRSLPFGTRVRVTNLDNGRSTVVRINDRGPFHGGRIIDLAHGAAGELGVTASGLAQVRLEVLD